MSDSGNYVFTGSYEVYGASPLSEDKTLNLANFSFGIKMPGLRPRAAVINNPDARQKLVLGKISLLPSTSGDLFLVLSTKVY